MRQVARFWMLIGSFTVGVLTSGYLFLSFASFIAPDISLVTTTMEERLLVTAVALLSLGVFIWTFSFAGGPTPQTRPEQEDEDEDDGSRGPTLGNRNR